MSGQSLSNGVAFVIGGYSSKALNDVWSIQPGQGWKLCTAAAPRSARYGFMLGSIGDKIVICGGYTSTEILSDAWSSYDGVIWTQETEQMFPDEVGLGKRYYGGCISADNGIYLLGGFNHASAELGNVAFSADGKTWSYANDGTGNTWGAGGERVGSDETSVRVNGRNDWHWVFVGGKCEYHLIVPSRGYDVIESFMGEC